MLTPSMRRIQNSNAWFPYDRYGRHDRYRCSRCDRGRARRAIPPMTCFPLIVAIAAKTGWKPVVKLTSWCQIQSTTMVAVNRRLLLESCYFLVLSIIRRSYIKLLNDFGPEIHFHKHAMLISAELVVPTIRFLLFFPEQHAVRGHQMIEALV